MWLKQANFGRLTLVWALVFSTLGPPAGGQEPQATLTEGFESDRPTWRQEDTDTAVRLLAHDRSGRARHAGLRSERFVFQSDGVGSSLYYSLPLPRIPLVDDLEVSLYVRANQPGVQLLAQVILPGDTDPETGEPSFVRISGATTDAPDRWQRLELSDLKTSVERQVRLLRYQTRRPIPLEGAFIDRLVVNLFCGGGIETEVFIDDLRISPAPESAVMPAEEGPLALEPGVGADLPELPAATNPVSIRLEAGRLTRDGRDWVPSILRAPGADPAIALPFGFDVLSVAADAPDDTLKALAAQPDALLMPDLGVLSTDGVEPANPTDVLESIDRLSRLGVVAFWDLGEALGGLNDESQRDLSLDRVRDVLDGLRERDSQTGSTRLVTGTVVGDFTRLAMPGQSLDLMGVDAKAWGMREPTDTISYLLQRRELTALWNLSAPYWAWVDTAVPHTVRQAVWGNEPPPAWGIPRVQPEQVRQATYMALMAGYRGLGFQGDPDLTREPGQMLLYELSLLNAEIDLVEPIIARGSDPIQTLPTYPPDPDLTLSAGGMTQSDLGRANRNAPPELPPHPSIRAAAITTQDGRGRLILIADLKNQSQWQPAQEAFNDLSVVVPGAPPSSQALEIRLGGGRWLERDRVPGGVRFKLPEFGVATMVLLTTDLQYGEQIRRAIERIRPRAVDLALKQARDQLLFARELNGRLALDGHYTRDSADLLALAERSLSAAEQARAREDFELAWDEARRVARPLRILLRAHWDMARMSLTACAQFMRDREAKIPPQTSRAPGQVDPYAAARKKLPPLIVPVTASAPLVAIQTLPQHFVWCDWIKLGQFSENLLPDGDFEESTPAGMAEAGWTDSSYRDSNTRSAVRLTRAALPTDKGRGQVLKLSVRPPDGRTIDQVPAFLDHPAAAIRTPPVPVKARQFYRISAVVRMPLKVPGGAGGLIVRDSLGGESLQFQTTDPIADWSQIYLFRRVPADGNLTVTIGLAGYGDVYLDDVRIERLDKVSGDSPGIAPPANLVRTPPAADTPPTPAVDPATADSTPPSRTAQGPNPTAPPIR